MNINTKLLSAVIASCFILNSGIAIAQMTPEASVLYQQACSAEHQQDYKEAISKLEQAIRLSGEDTILYTKLAGLYSDMDMNDKALELYKKVIELKPDDSFVYISIGRIYEDQSKYKDALIYYEKALDIFPEYKYSYYNIAGVQYQLRDYNNAIKNYNIFLDTYSQHLEARENLAASYIAVADYQNAEKQYRRLYSKNPEEVKYFLPYGLSLLNTNHQDKAVEFLEKAIVVDPENMSAHLGLAQSYQDLKKNDLAYEQYKIVIKNVKDLDPAIKLDYANLLSDMNKNTEAIAQYNEYIKQNPNSEKGYMGIAKVYKNLNNYDYALQNYLLAERKMPDNIDLKKDIAFCYHNKKDYNNSIKYYDEILEKQPKDYNVRFNKALALHALHNYQDAIDIYKGLLDEKSDRTVKDNLNNALVSRGHELVELGESSDAIVTFKSALKNGCVDSYAYFGLAKAYRKLGDNTKASENYEKAISIDPERTQYSSEYSEFISSLYSSRAHVSDVDNDGAISAITISMDNDSEAQTFVKTSALTMKQNEDLIASGDENYKKNQYEAALKNYQDALQILPNDAVTLLKIGNIYKLQEEYTKAINYYQKSIIVNPDYTDGWFNLGLAYANENNFIEAKKSFEKVISLDTDYNLGYAYYALAIALEQEGKNSEAVKNYKLFLKYNNDKDAINAVQEKIKQLQ